MRVKLPTRLLWALLLGTTFAGWAQAADPAPAAAKESPAKAGDADFEGFEGEFGKGKGAKKVFDPLRGYNRVMFHVNDKLYFFLFKPLALGYGLLVPQPVRVAVGRSYANLAFPVRFVGSALQAKWHGVGRETGRFLINSTLGVGGLFDPAEKWFHIRPSDEDIGQAFGHWGIGTGFPVVLPLLGQSNLRDGLGTIPNTFLNPVYYVADTNAYIGTTAGGYFNSLSLRMDEYEKLRREALDPYTFFRDAHLQNRQKKVNE